MYFSTTPDCLTPSADVGSSRINTRARRSTRAGDRHRLTFTARKRADGLVDVAHVDAHLPHLGLGGPLAKRVSIHLIEPKPFCGSAPRKKLRHTDISGAIARSWKTVAMPASRPRAGDSKCTG